MKKFFLWQACISLVIIAVYPISLARGFGGNNGVCYTMICVALTAMWAAHLQKIEVLSAIRPGLDLLPRHTVVTSIVLSAITFWIAKKSGATLSINLVICGAVLLLSAMVVVEATLAMIILIMIFAVGFGTPFAAALMYFFIMLLFARAIAGTEMRTAYRWMVFSGALQAVGIYYFFICVAKLFEHRILLH